MCFSFLTQTWDDPWQPWVGQWCICHEAQRLRIWFSQTLPSLFLQPHTKRQKVEALSVHKTLALFLYEPQYPTVRGKFILTHNLWELPGKLENFINRKTGKIFTANRIISGFRALLRTLWTLILIIVAVQKLLEKYSNAW